MRYFLRYGTFWVALALFLGVFPATQAYAANAFPQVEPSLALIGSVDSSGHLQSVGSAFCVASQGNVSYFLTNNHVVTDQNDHPDHRLVAILAQDMNEPHPTRHKAIIVRRQDDPDLSVVEVDGVSIPPLHISTSLPQVGDDVAIAGFPYNESVLWGQLFGGTSLRLDRRFPPELEPSYHRGTVSAIHGGGYYIQYDALTDHGNSGGPLFDPATGDVYGVVQAAVEGAPEYRNLPSPIHNNLAISIREGWTFIAEAPVEIPNAAAVASAGEHFTTNRCKGHASGQIAYVKAAIAQLQAHVNDPKYASRHAEIRKALSDYQKALHRWQKKSSARSCV